MQKELQNVLNAIDKWTKKNKNDVTFVGFFVSTDPKKLKNKEEDIILDSRIIGYGNRKVVESSIQVLQDNLKADKSEFINW